MTNAEHWDSVYASKTNEQLGWYEVAPVTSLRLLTAAVPADDDASVVGAGTSRLATVLLDTGWTDVTIMDVSAEALAPALGEARAPRFDGGGSRRAYLAARAHLVGFQ
jgi:hypothetical protein